MDFFSTYISPKASDYVAATLAGGHISEGRLVKEFEGLLSSQFGLANPVAVNSGTSALVLALLASNVGPGDYVIVPSQTFVATALAVLQVGAKVWFADIDPRTGCMTGKTLRAALDTVPEKPKAVIVVHWAGYSCGMKSIGKEADGLFIIEDAAQALGAIYKGKPVGSCKYSDFTCFSFQAIKHLTTGDGGAVCSEFVDDLRALRWFGIDRETDKPDELGERQYLLEAGDIPGGKYHMNDYAATLGIANTEGFEGRMWQRHILAIRYDELLCGLPGITLPAYKSNRTSAYWLYPILLDGPDARLNLVRCLQAHGIPSSVVHQRIDKHPLFGGHTTMDQRPGQTEFDARQLNLPIHDAMTVADAERVCEVIRGGW